MNILTYISIYSLYITFLQDRFFGDWQVVREMNEMKARCFECGFVGTCREIKKVTFFLLCVRFEQNSLVQKYLYCVKTNDLFNLEQGQISVHTPAFLESCKSKHWKCFCNYYS